VNYAHDCQGLLEAPFQAVFTLTLIVLGFLPTPLESLNDKNFLIKNGFGQTISREF
jgi:hypothetical protein